MYDTNVIYLNHTHSSSDINPTSRRSLVHFQVVAHHLPEADMYDVAV